MAKPAKLEEYEELMVQLLARISPSKGPALVAKLPAKWLAAGLTAKQLAALPAEKLAALPIEKVMAGRSVRERLAGLSPAELEVLRAELGVPAPAKAKPKRRAKATR